MDLTRSARENTRVRLQHLEKNINARRTHENKPVNRTLAYHSREFLEDTGLFQWSKLNRMDDQRGPPELSHKPRGLLSLANGAGDGDGFLRGRARRRQFSRSPRCFLPLSQEVPLPSLSPALERPGRVLTVPREVFLYHPSRIWRPLSVYGYHEIKLVLRGEPCSLPRDFEPARVRPRSRP